MAIDVYTPFERLAIDCIDTESLDIKEDSTNFDKVQKVFNEFKGEVGYNIPRVGEKQAFTDWLQGLPSCLDFPFEYHTQLDWATGSGIVLDTEDKEDNFLENFFISLTAAFFTLRDNL